ncbi:unnamed protein product [Durusdinium trenchii]|uniref:Chromate transporter n=1 Tax=Durusdinium trenchii TaxID=1381693 RepID=A0ABP0NGW5_9DINO
MGEAEAPVDVEAPATSRSVGFCDIAKHFVLMGWTAFGGPAAHVGLFQKTFVERLGWMSADVFTELFAVCQCMPGPSSTQMSFALGTTKQGILGGLLSGILFQYPGAIMMTILGMTAHNWATPQVIAEHTWLAGLVGGLSAAGVALVASAAIGLWAKACGPADAKALAGFCCVVLLYYSAELMERNGRDWMWIFPFLIILGGAFTYFWRPPPETKACWIRVVLLANLEPTREWAKPPKEQPPNPPLASLACSARGALRHPRGLQAPRGGPGSEGSADGSCKGCLARVSGARVWWVRSWTW